MDTPHEQEESYLKPSKGKPRPKRPHSAPQPPIASSKHERFCFPRVRYEVFRPYHDTKIHSHTMAASWSSSPLTAKLPPACLLPRNHSIIQDIYRFPPYQQRTPQPCSERSSGSTLALFLHDDLLNSPSLKTQEGIS